MTGAGGYIGTHVVPALVQRGFQVVAAQRDDVPAGPSDPSVTWIEADVLADPTGLLETVGEVDVLLHMAWEAGFVHNDPVHMLRLSDHYRFLDAAVSAGVPHVAVLGTMHEVGYHEGAIDENTPTRPRSLYGVAKNALREALTVRLSGTDTVLQWLRCYYITGDDARSRSVFAKISEAARSGARTFPFNSGRNKYDFIDVDELAGQIAAVVDQTAVTGVINCSSGEPVALADRVERFVAENGFDLTLEYGAFPDRPYDSPAVWGDATKIRAVLAAEAER